MSEFEKKTLLSAFFWMWWLTVLDSPYLLFTPKNIVFASEDTINWVWLINFKVKIAVGGLLVIGVLNSIFGLWQSFWSEEGGLFSKKLTEQEKFLSYKATGRTLIVFAFVTCIALFCSGQWTVSSRVIKDVFLMTVVAFMAAKSYVLFAFLRSERLRNLQKNKKENG